MSSTANQQEETRFNRTAWLVLVYALALVLLSAAQIVYRYTLPTDGWAVYTTQVDQADWVYSSNLVGAPSGLQQNDALLAVDDLPVQGSATSYTISPPPSWAAGQSVDMTVQRGEQEVSIRVPIVHWTPAALWRYNIADLSRLVDLLGALTLFIVSLFTLTRRPAVPSAWALLVFCATFFATSLSGLLPDGLPYSSTHWLSPSPLFLAISFLAPCWRHLY